MWRLFSGYLRSDEGASAVAAPGAESAGVLTIDLPEAPAPRPGGAGEPVRIDSPIADVQNMGDALVVTLTADRLDSLDGEPMGDFAELLQQIEASGRRRVVIDLQNIMGFDRVCAEALMAAAIRMLDDGVRLAMVCGVGMNELLAAMGTLRERLPLARDVMAAVAAVRRPAAR